MARVAEAPAVGNGGDRQSRAHEIVARRCKPMRSHHGTDGVAGRSESPVHGARGDVEGTRQIAHPDDAPGEVIGDPGLHLLAQHGQQIAGPSSGPLAGADDARDQGEQCSATRLDTAGVEPIVLPVDAGQEVQQQPAQRAVRGLDGEEVRHAASDVERRHRTHRHTHAALAQPSGNDDVSAQPRPKKHHRTRPQDRRSIGQIDVHLPVTRGQQQQRVLVVRRHALSAYGVERRRSPVGDQQITEVSCTE